VRDGLHHELQLEPAEKASFDQEKDRLLQIVFKGKKLGEEQVTVPLKLTNPKDAKERVVFKARRHPRGRGRCR